MKVLFWALFAVLVSTNAYAGEDAPLDPAPKSVLPVLEHGFGTPGIFGFNNELPAASNLAHLLGLQTPVKAQGKRGTCSIFSATGIVESLIKKRFQQELDLSENYLEYLVMSRMKGVASEGSDTPTNIPAIQKWGTIVESHWPYEEYDWTAADLPAEEKARAQATCGHLSGNPQKACLLSHMDPFRDPFYKHATQFFYDYMTHRLGYYPLGSQQQIRERLFSGAPLVLSLEFFYGAWNHRKMTEYGIGERDMDAWAKGIVSTPNARDITISRKHPAGHSFIIVGYDDTKRVYYFKNSWGTTGFGVKSDLLGESTSAGYGTITYDYAHSYGTFYDVSYR